MTWLADSLRTVSRFTGAHHDTLRRSWIAAGMPGSKGSWDLRAIARWRLARAAERLEARRLRAKPAPNSEAEAERQLAWLKVDRARVRLEDLQAQYIGRQDVYRETAMLYRECRRLLLEMPDQFAAAFAVEADREPIRHDAQSAIRAVLDVLQDNPWLRLEDLHDE